MYAMVGRIQISLFVQPTFRLKKSRVATSPGPPSEPKVAHSFGQGPYSSFPEGRPGGVSRRVISSPRPSPRRRPRIHAFAVTLPFVSHGGSAILPELEVAILAEGAPLDEAPALAHQLLDGDTGSAEEVEVVGDDVAVAAGGAGDEHAAVVVALLGDVVGGARAAGNAGECQLV